MNGWLLGERLYEYHTPEALWHVVKDETWRPPPRKLILQSPPGSHGGAYADTARHRSLFLVATHQLVRPRAEDRNRPKIYGGLEANTVGDDLASDWSRR